MPPAFLAVLSQPSSSLTLADFHAWYEDEHIPLRLNHLPSFLSGARYHAIDGAEAGPGWLAMYEIDDTQTFASPSYAGLRDTRSARESDVISRLDMLVRWACEDLGVWGRGESMEEGSTTGLKAGKPSEFVVTQNLEANDDSGAKAWADQIANESKAVRGWVRMRVVKVLESGTTKMGVAVRADEVKYIVVHEFTSVAEGADIEALYKAASSIGGSEVEQWRAWKLYKAYPSIAQGAVLS